MRHPNQHIIQKSRLQLQVGAHLDAQQLQSRVLDIFQYRIMPKMEAVLDSLAGPDVVLHFDRLELQLGDLPADALDAQLEAKILEQLRVVILRALVQGGSAAATEWTKADPVSASIAHVVHFLERGTLTWSHAAPDYVLSEAVTELLAADGKRVVAQLLPVLAQATPRRRFQLQLPPAVIAEFLAHVHPAWRRAWEGLPALVAELHALLEWGALMDGGPIAAQAKDFVLELAAADAAGTLLPPYIPIARQLQDGHVALPVVAKAWLAQAIVAAPARGSVPVLSALLREMRQLAVVETTLAFVLLEALVDMPGAALPAGIAEALPQQVAAVLAGRELPEPTVQRLVAAIHRADPGLLPRIRMRAPQQVATLDRLLAALPMAQDPDAAKSDKPLEKAHAVEAASPANQLDTSGADTPHIDSLEAAATASPAQRPSRIQQASPPRTPSGSSAAIEHYVQHAGLVLLNPFFQHCFDGLGWLSGGEFVDEDRREDAVMLMAYIATGAWEHQEGDLMLEKLLCGMPLEAPIRMEVSLPESTLEEAENLIQSAAHYWDKLGAVSTESFRYTFLHREGVLRPSASGWLLKVNRTGLDILMEFMPWGYGIVRLPWMRTILSVDW